VNEFPTITSAANYFYISSRTVGSYLDKDTSYKRFIFRSYVKNK
jgi:hypothetical protein